MKSTITRLSGVEWHRQGPAFLTGLGHAGTHWVAGIFYVLLPFITRELGLSYVQAGALVGVLHASSFAANFVSGMLVDMSGRRVVFQVLSLLMGAAALGAFAISTSFVALAVLTALLGVSNNLWHPPAIAYLAQSYPNNRGYALAIHALCANVGDTVAPAAAGLLIAAAGWSATAGWGCLPALVIAALIAVLMLPSDRVTAATHRSHGAMSDYWRGVAGIVRNRAIAGLCVMAGFRSMTQNGLYVFLPLYLVNEVGTGPVVMGFAMAMLQLGGVVAAPVAGIASDRIGRRPVVMAGLTVTTLMVIALTFVSNQVVYVAGVSLLGFALFAVRPVVHSWMMDLAPSNMAGSATSLVFGTQSIFSMTMPVIGGMIADHYGLPAVFYFLAITVLLANLLVFALPRDVAPAGAH